MADNRKFVGGQPYYLAGAGATAAATSIILRSFETPDGTPIVMATHIGAVGHGTLEPKTSKVDYITFTGVTQNADGTATLTGVTHVKGYAPYDTATGQAHAGGATFILSNTPSFYNDFPNKANDETITGDWLVPTPVNPTSIANKDYIDQISIAGATNATDVIQGLVEIATQAEVDAGTETGATGASIVATPATTRGKLINDYAVDSVGTDAYAITITPAITAYAAGQVFTFKAGTANTGPATLNVSGLGAKDIKKNVSVALATGDILANEIVMVEYDGTNMQLIGRNRNIDLASEVTGLLPVANGGRALALPFKNGATTYDMSTASGVQNIAHGLGVAPTKIRLTGTYSGGDNSVSQSVGVYNGTTQSMAGWALDTTNGYEVAYNSTTATIELRLSGTVKQAGSVTVDATNIIITWTKTGTPTGTASIMWEVET